MSCFSVHKTFVVRRLGMFLFFAFWSAVQRPRRHWPSEFLIHFNDCLTLHLNDCWLCVIIWCYVLMMLWWYIFIIFGQRAPCWLVGLVSFVIWGDVVHVASPIADEKLMCTMFAGRIYLICLFGWCRACCGSNRRQEVNVLYFSWLDVFNLSFWVLSRILLARFFLSWRWPLPRGGRNIFHYTFRVSAPSPNFVLGQN